MRFSQQARKVSTILLRFSATTLLEFITSMLHFVFLQRVTLRYNFRKYRDCTFEMSRQYCYNLIGTLQIYLAFHLPMMRNVAASVFSKRHRNIVTTLLEFCKYLIFLSLPCNPQYCRNFAKSYFSSPFVVFAQHRAASRKILS